MISRYSKIYIREEKKSKSVRIGSDSKPEIIETAIDNWQSLLDTATKIVRVPSAIIMRINEKNREVFLKNESDDDTYTIGESSDLNVGLYCENVVGSQKKLLIADATKDDLWKENNLDLEKGMVAYFGFPINWPHGEVFGTLCVMDTKENHFGDEYTKLLTCMKHQIEADLKLLILNDELNEKNKELEKLNISKSNFLSLISHDVRGGIGIIDEFLKLLVENWRAYDDEKLISILRSLSQSAGAAYLTLDNLLNWSKNDLASLIAEKTKVDVIQVVDDLLDYFRQAIATKELKIETEYYAKKAFVAADENMLNVSFRNILSNAIKYTSEGGNIWIRVSPVGTQHCIEFEDSGIGMDIDTVNKLFTYDKFHKKFGTNGEESAGVGLILTKEFLDKNNAKVEVKSELNKGTIFRVTI